MRKIRVGETVHPHYWVHRNRGRGRRGDGHRSSREYGRDGRIADCSVAPPCERLSCHPFLATWVRSVIRRSSELRGDDMTIVPEPDAEA